QKERAAKINLSTFLLDEGLRLCEKGDVDLGMLWLARSLENAPKKGADDLQRVIRVNLAGWSRLTHHLRAFWDVPGNAVEQAVFSLDGETILSLCRSGFQPQEIKLEARIFDASTGKLTGTSGGGLLPAPWHPPSSGLIMQPAQGWPQTRLFSP